MWRSPMDTEPKKSIITTVVAFSPVRLWSVDAIRQKVNQIKWLLYSFDEDGEVEGQDQE